MICSRELFLTQQLYRLLVVCNRSVDIDCGSQSIDLFPTISVKCNGSETRDFISFMLSELVATQRLHSTNRNYYALWLSSDSIGLVSGLDSQQQIFTIDFPSGITTPLIILERLKNDENHFRFEYDQPVDNLQLIVQLKIKTYK